MLLMVFNKVVNHIQDYWLMVDFIVFFKTILHN